MTYPRVVSIGEPLVEFISPRIGKSISEATQLRKCPAGAAAVFATAVANLGTQSELLGKVGDDEFADYLKSMLKIQGVEISQVTKAKGFQTGLAFTSYDKAGRRKYIYYRKESPGTQLSREDINIKYLSKARVLHFPGTTLIASNSSKEAIVKAIQAVTKNGSLVSFDPNIRTEMLSISKIRKIYNEFWKYCDLITPSAEEISLLTGCDALDKAAQKLLRKGPKIVAVTLGSKGCFISTKDDVFYSPAFKVKSVDSTGAGDAFNAAFVVGLVEKRELKDIARFANATGALTVRKIGHIGYALPTRKEVDKFMGVGLR